MITKLIIFLISTLFVINQSLLLNESLNLNEENNNLKITQEAMKIVEKVIDRIHFKSNNSHNISKKKEASNKKNNENEQKLLNPLENQDLFEGDIVLTPYQASQVVEEAIEIADKKKVNVSDIVSETKRRKKRKISVDVDYKWEFPIPYYCETKVNQNIIDEALKQMEKETCIRFEKQDKLFDNKAGLVYHFGTGCHSQVGRIHEKKPQIVSLGDDCDTIGTTQHETMHALGAQHEQSRVDRDEYLNIFLENILPDKEKNFLKMESNNAVDYKIPYDYGSEMQYYTRSFSANNNPTMLPTDKMYTATLGINAGMSFLDIQLLNSHFCSKKCSKKIECFNGGYQDPNNCNICKCVKGFEGSTCSDFPKESKECGKSVINVRESDRIPLITKGKKDCIYHLISMKDGRNIKITINEIQYLPTQKYSCELRDSLEVKFLNDKRKTGALLCGINKNLVFNAKDQHVIINHRSTKEENMMDLSIELI